ncbi:MAG TPA: FHA domain-containing protein [Polyangia bacterium]
MSDPTKSRADKRGGGSRAGAASVRRGPKARAQAGRKGFILTITDGRNAGREYFFEHEASLGRTDENNVIIVDPGVSRRHAHIAGSEGIYTVEDLGSSNGTRLNGDKLATPEVLRDGDYIQIGETTMLFSVLDVAHEEVTGRTSFAEIEEAAADKRFTQEHISVGLRLRRLFKNRAVVLVLAIIVVGGGGFGGYRFLRSGRAGLVLDRSSEVIAYSDADDFFNKVYGFGTYDKTHREKVQFDFEYLGGRATLQYGAWGLDKVGELQVLLNGEKVAEPPLTMGRWVYGLKVVFPREKLKKGGTNRVAFKSTLNPPGKDKWEVCYVQIVQEAIPPANREEARQQFDFGKKAFEDREISPGNLYVALTKFKKTRDLLEELPDKPEIYQEALDLIDKTDQALTQKFQDALFDARRADRFKGADESKKILRRALGFFAKEDFRYREIKRQIDAAEGD